MFAHMYEYTKQKTDIGSSHTRNHHKLRNAHEISNNTAAGHHIYGIENYRQWKVNFKGSYINTISIECMDIQFPVILTTVLYQVLDHVYQRNSSLCHNLYSRHIRSMRE